MLFRSSTIVDLDAATSDLLDLKILQGITLIEDMRELLSTKP